MRNKYVSNLKRSVLKRFGAVAMAVCVTASMGCFDQNVVKADTEQTFAGTANHLEVVANGDEDQYGSTVVKVNPGEVAELSVTVTADNMEGLTYEWTYTEDGTTIVLESSTEKCTTPKIEKTCSYYCKVTDCYGNSKKVSFNVQVENHLKTSVNDQGMAPTISVGYGEDVDLYLTVTADNMEEMKYSWWDPEDNKISSTDKCTISNVTKPGMYGYMIIDCYGNVTSIYFWISIDAECSHDSMLEAPSKVATCTQEGNIAYWYCNDCGKLFSDNGAMVELTQEETIIAIDPANHVGDRYTVGVVPATEESSGYTGDIICEACKGLIQKGSIIPATGGNKKPLEVYPNGGNYTPHIYVEKNGTTELYVTVDADNVENLTYEWGYISDGHEENVVMLDSTSDRCTTDPIDKFYEYFCRVTDGNGNEEMAYFLVGVENHLTVYANGEKIFSYSYVELGQSAELSVEVTADNTEGLRYEWAYSDNGDLILLECTSNKLVVDNIQSAQKYRCKITDCYGNSDYYAWFDINVNKENHLAIYPAGTTDASKTLYVSNNEPFTLAVDVTADDMEGLTYNWYYSNADNQIRGSIPAGEDPSVCQIDGLEQYMTYRCEVTDQYGNSKDALFFVYVNADTITANDSGEDNLDIEVAKGEKVTLTAHSKKGNEAAYTYSWVHYDFESGDSITLSSDTNVCIIENVQNDMQIGVTIKDPEYGNTYYLTYNIYAKDKADDSTKGDDSNTDSGNADGDNTSGGTTGDGSTDNGTTGGTTTGGSTTETPGSGGTGSSGAGSGTTSDTTGGATVSGASTTTDEKKDDSKTDKKVTTNKDGSVKEVVKEKDTNSKGKEVTVTTTTEKDKKGNVTSVAEKTKIDNIASDASATVTVKTDKKGSTTATASVEKKIASERKTTTISSSMIEQIKEAAGTDVDITMTVKDEKGNTKYKVKADTADLKKGKDLYIYKLNTKTGEYVMVNDKTYSVSDKGNVSVKLDNKGTYELVSATDAKKIEKKILATVQAKKTAASVKKGKKTSIALSNKLNMSNVKSITYSTDSKSVATVSKKGAVTAKGKGTTTIKATVTLKNGKTKTVKMKVTVK